MRKRPRPQNVVLPGVMKPPSRPWETVAIDFSGPYPETRGGNKWVLTMICCFSRYPICIPLPSRHATLVASAILDNMLQYFPRPKFVVTDNGQELIGHVLKDLFRLFRIRHIRTKPHTPSLNPYVERFHAYLTASMTILGNRFKDDWDRQLALICMNYRNTVCSSTGYSPMEVVFGQRPQDTLMDSFAEVPRDRSHYSYVRRMHNAFTTVHTDLVKSHARHAEINRQRRMKKYRKSQFRAGDWVLVWQPHIEKAQDQKSRKYKLMDRWSLPRRVVCPAHRPDYYVIRDLTGKLCDVRADSMQHYSPYFDGLPSCAPRPRLTKEERKARLKPQDRKWTIHKGDMLLFPLTMSNGKYGFGVGKAHARRRDRSWNLHWYSNAEDSLYTAFFPCWIEKNKASDRKSWYAASNKLKSTDKPMLTTKEFYPASEGLTEANCIRFHFIDDCLLPTTVLHDASEHPKFGYVFERRTLV